jgi:radical SAM superfamily enzyme YgiQ (UPF0313 family)
MRKIKVWLVGKGVFDMAKLTMPLSLGYAKAVAMADDNLRDEVDIRIFNYRGGDKLHRMIQEVLVDDMPDILAFSVFGWNYNVFGRMTETFRQMNPDGWVIFGGTHVANQGERVFRMWPSVGVVVNGESEVSFPGLLRAYLAGSPGNGRKLTELHEVPGISFIAGDGELVTTPSSRISDLNTIPSPFLTGALPMQGPDGEFLYDAVLMETNRGCPYKCAFCYWGGAIGQKIRQFDTARIHEELKYFGRLNVSNVCLTDANFGMLPADVEFVDNFLSVRSEFGFPRSLDTCWAKNKSKIFYEVVKKMKDAGLQSDFGLSLQSLTTSVIETMNRKNMKLNDFEDLCDWLAENGLEAYAELIWGLPGETYESFLEGYDRVSQYVPRIYTYAHLMLPNTDYSQKRDDYKIVTMRNDEDDFEYVISHSTMTPEDDKRMQAYLFWSRLFIEHPYFRFIWPPLNKLLNLSHSQILLGLDAWFDQSTDPLAIGFVDCKRQFVEEKEPYPLSRGMRYLYAEPGMESVFESWWREVILPKAPPDLRPFFMDLFRYEFFNQAISDQLAAMLALEGVEVCGLRYHLRQMSFGFDVARISHELRCKKPCDIRPKAMDLTYYYKAGFADFADYQPFILQYVGKPLEQVIKENGKESSEGKWGERGHVHRIEN